MKKIYFKSIIKSIYTSINRFLAIMLITSLGVGFLTGLTSSTPDMQISVNKFYNDNNFMDINILSSMGLVDDDLRQIKTINNLEKVTPCYTLDIYLNGPNMKTYSTRLHSLNDFKHGTNTGKLVKGRYPTKKGEILIEGRRNIKDKLDINDILEISTQNINNLDILEPKNLKIVGIINTPTYFSYEKEPTTIGNGNLDLIIYLMDNNFKSDIYTNVMLTIKHTSNLNTFSERYNNTIEEVKQKLEQIKITQTAKRYNNIKNEALKELNQYKLDFDTQKLQQSENLLKIKQLYGTNSNEYTLLKNKLEDYTKQFDKIYAKKNEDINNLEYPKWFIQDRHDNISFESFKLNTEKVNDIAKIFPVFFYLVAILVCLTSMTRMIEEERMLIGTFKALGYSKTLISIKYLFYASLASILGAFMGVLIGSKLFPSVIWNAYEMMYILPPLITKLNVDIILLSSIVMILCIILSTLYVCLSSLKELPAKLLLPRVPKIGKRIFLEHINFIWKRLSFTQKVTARNIFRYKKRFFMTIIGIAGCTSLLLTGFGVRDSIHDIIEKQFGDIFKYNFILNIKQNTDNNNSPLLYDTLNDKNLVTNYVKMYQKNVIVESDNSSYIANSKITVIQNNDINNFIKLKNSKLDKDIIYDSKSIIITKKLAEKLKVNIGDNINITDNKKNINLKITDITDNYVYSYIYISQENYNKYFNKQIYYNMIIGTYNTTKINNHNILAKNTLSEDNVNFINFISDTKVSFRNLLKNIDYIVIVLISSAALLAFIVLYNLIDINISERTKEIATLKVLGFYHHEVARYIYKETIILSIIGSLLGLLGGIYLHKFVVLTAEAEDMMFGRNVYTTSYIFSFGLTILFSLVIELFMNKKLKNINMIESLKANE